MAKRVCRSCGKVFDEGTREWPELTLAKKLRFLFPPWLLGIFGGFELPGILVLFIASHDEHRIFLFVFSSVIAFGIVIMWLSVRLIWVVRSKRRFSRISLAKS
jgi:uncharacterized membrane protein YedE/YeeE